MKVGCLIYSDHEKYKTLHENAVKSFTTFHPNVELYSFDIFSDCDLLNSIRKEIKTPLAAGPYKYKIGEILFEKEKLDKLIILGADTITCSRLDEFLDDNDHDILTTLDYPYDLMIGIYLLATKDNHVNADVVCFNNKKALQEVLDHYNHNKTHYFEQASLNYICNVQKKFTSKIVDRSSEVLYNVRSKGNFCAKPNTVPWSKYMQKYEVVDHKLFTGTHEYMDKSKQIKIWHYCQGFGCINSDEINEIITLFANECFNEETKKFFREICGLKNFV